MVCGCNEWGKQTVGKVFEIEQLIMQLLKSGRHFNRWKVRLCGG